MSPLRRSTLGVVGAGVMAEAIIAGVLERKLLAADILEPTAGTPWAKNTASMSRPTMLRRRAAVTSSSWGSSPR
jgi:pyrroline-5-carboxylate reductase